MFHSSCHNSRIWKWQTDGRTDIFIMAIPSCGIFIGLTSQEPMAIEASCLRAGWQMTWSGEKNNLHRLMTPSSATWKYSAPGQWYIWLKRLPITWAVWRRGRRGSNPAFAYLLTDLSTRSRQFRRDIRRHNCALFLAFPVFKVQWWSV